jgi:hypothetical protein
MGVMQRVHINDTKLSHKTSQATTLLTIVALSIVLFIGIYFASASPGTALGELVSMTVFPQSRNAIEAYSADQLGLPEWGREMR